MTAITSLPLSPIDRRLLLIVHDPTVPSAGGGLLSQVFGWGDPGDLTSAFIEEMAYCSFGLARFAIQERLDVDEFPPKADGFRYTAESFLDCWRRRGGFHGPDLVDYPSLISQFGLLERVRSGDIDEVWLFGFPYAGYYESIMAGPGAFWCNSPPLADMVGSGRRFVIMGFNYERDVGEMMESFGHRAESIMRQVYSDKHGESNLWERFIRHNKTHPGRAEVGNIHFAPNSERDYDWGNRRKVASRCDDWAYFPDLQGRTRQVDCSEWGNGDIRLHHRWWYRHLPHVEGESNGVSNNWWSYILDPNLV
jgi:hypothetical protein